ncbi:MAG: hypothetical protein ACI8U0_001607 [Flavobacteriales bacterium]
MAQEQCTVLLIFKTEKYELLQIQYKFYTNSIQILYKNRTYYYLILTLFSVTNFTNLSIGQTQWDECVLSDEASSLQLEPNDAIPPCTDQTILYISDEFTFSKTIKINIHFMHKSATEPLNFTAIDDGNGGTVFTGDSVAALIVHYANHQANDNEQMNLPPGNNTAILDQKIKYELQGVYYDVDETDYSYPECQLYCLRNNHGINMDTELNIFYQWIEPVINEPLYIPSFAYVTEYGGQGVAHMGKWQKYVIATSVSEQAVLDQFWGAAGTILHETGHNFAMRHPMKTGGGSCSFNVDDFCSDTPTIQEILDLGYPDPCECNDPGAICGNTFMDYGGGSAYTPEQLGRIHYHIIHNKLDYLVDDYCYKYYDENFTISDGEHIILEASKLINKDIIIEDGGKLTVKCYLHLAENVKIVVEQGGELVVDGGILSNLCGDLWKGVYVAGDPAGQGTSNNPGKAVFLNDAIVENASTAVRNYAPTSSGSVDWSKTGGIIISNDATFINNKRDVEFMEYLNTNNSGNPIRDISSFSLTNFTVNDEFIGSNIIDNVTLYKCNGVKFNGCDFSDQRTGLFPYNKRVGIYARASTIQVNEYCTGATPNLVPPTCDGTRSSFSNMEKAIYINGKSNALFFSEIRNSDFKTCWRGVYNYGQYNPEIILNNFEVTPYQGATPGVNNWPVGVYLAKNTRGYVVEENEFYPVENSTDVGSGTAVGIVAYTGHGETEEIYNNEFRHLTVGIESLGQNRFDDISTNTHKGLRLTCNDFSKNRVDIFAAQGNQNAAYFGIAQDQGFAPTDLAFNTFTATNYHNIDNEVDFINYRYKDNDPPHFPSETFELNLPDITVNLDGVFIGAGNYCPSILEISEFVLQDDRANARASRVEKEVQMAQVLDGGDTEGLRTDVALTTNIDAWNKYIMLMSQAGYITEEVLKELTVNESGFTLAMTRDILVANPHSAKSKDIDEALDARANPLPEYMREQIKLGLTQMSAKDFLQMQKDKFKKTEDLTTRKLVHHYLKEELTENNKLALVSLLSNTNDIDNDYHLVELYDNIGESNLGDALLSLMDGAYELKPYQLVELDRYISLRQLLNNWKNQNKDLTLLNEADISLLENYILIDDRAGWEAKSVLIFNNVFASEEMVLLPDFDKKFDPFKPKPQSNENNNHGEINIFPNPANEFTTVAYQIDRAFNSGNIRLVNASGVVVFSQEIVNEQDQIIIRESNSFKMISGIYQCELLIDGETYLVEKLIVK